MKLPVLLHHVHSVMKPLTSTTFGHQKEVQSMLYKQYIRPVLEYASPAWCPDLAPTYMLALQGTPNAALHIATGCVRFRTSMRRQRCSHLRNTQICGKCCSLLGPPARNNLVPTSTTP